MITLKCQSLIERQKPFGNTRTSGMPNGELRTSSSCELSLPRFSQMKSLIACQMFRFRLCERSLKCEIIFKRLMMMMMNESLQRSSPVQMRRTCSQVAPDYSKTSTERRTNKTTWLATQLASDRMPQLISAHHHPRRAATASTADYRIPLSQPRRRLVTFSPSNTL